MHAILTYRPEMPWTHIRRGITYFVACLAVAVALYVLTAPPIVKAAMKAQIRHSGHVHWPVFYAPLLLGLESDSPMIHGAFKWYFNNV
jgi:hypothetical protein